ncbi:MAG: hypothetical protein AB7W59_07165 [Acidimicrobiia bacterium]
MSAGLVGLAVATAAGCVEQFKPTVEAGDVINTRYGSAKVELVTKSNAGPIYRLVFSRCDEAMRADDFDPVADAGAPKPPSLQNGWIWSCRS